jgi:glyoxylase-like metal-dependent hydrolase (beta-lactamase superfamily II)
MHAATALLLCLLANPAAARADAREPGAPAIPIEVTRVGERILVLDCLDVNVTAIATSRGIVIVDTGRSPGLMEAVARRIEQELGRSDVRYVINTHAHPDHSAGNQVFPEALILSHRNGPAFMRHGPADTPGARRFARDRVEKARAQLTSTDPEEARRARAELPARELLLADLQGRYAATPATLTFSDRCSLELGDVRIELSACGRAHSDSDILVYVPGEKVLLTGDLFCGPENLCFTVSPLVDVPGLASQIERVLSDPAGLETVVPGHGRLLSRADLSRLLGLMRERYAEFDGRRSAAATLDTMIAAVGIDQALARLAPPAAGGSDAVYFSEEEFDALAESYRSVGRLSEAIRVLTRVCPLFPGSTLLLDGLGRACEEAGDIPAAISSYEKSLALSPENPRIADRLKALRAR